MATFSSLLFVALFSLLGSVHANTPNFLTSFTLDETVPIPDRRFPDTLCACLNEQTQIIYLWSYLPSVWQFNIKAYWNGKNGNQFSEAGVISDGQDYTRGCFADSGVCSQKRHTHYLWYYREIDRMNIDTFQYDFQWQYFSEDYGRSHPAVALDGNEDWLFVTGGNSFEPKNSFFLFNLDTEQLSEGPFMINGHAYGSAGTAIGNDGREYLYHFGELAHNIERIDVTSIDDVLANQVQWVDLGFGLNVDRELAIVGRRISQSLLYVIGGAGARPVEVLDASDQPQETLTIASSLKEPRQGPTVIWNPVDYRFYVFGGRTGNRNSRSWEYSNQLIPSCSFPDCTKSFCNGQSDDTRCSAKESGVDIFECPQLGRYCKIATCGDCGSNKSCQRTCTRYVRNNQLADSIDCQASCKGVSGKFKCWTPQSNC